MQLMMLAADFTAGEADQLRRAMAAWKRKGGLGPFQKRIVEGMVDKGYDREYAERIFKQVEGFGEYGFPESHAASFAFLVYISSWIKRHEPAAFLAAMIDSQPMGFYSTSQLIQDAKRHGVEVRPIDVAVSGWDSTLEEIEERSTPSPWLDAWTDPPCEARLIECAPQRPWLERFLADPVSVLPPDESDRSAVVVDTALGLDQQSRKAQAVAATIDTARAQPAVRLGFNTVNGFNEKAAERLVAARAATPFQSVEDLAKRAMLSTLELDALAAADALSSIAGHRRQARWQAASHRVERDLMQHAPIEEQTPQLPIASEASEIVDDYASTGFTLRRHPLALLRPRLTRMGLRTAEELHDVPDGRYVRTTGIVTVRQRPGTAKGTIFVTLEDETGSINVIVWKHVVRTQRRPVLMARLLTVHGTWQRQGEVRHLVANRMTDHSRLLGRLSLSSRDFH